MGRRESALKSREALQAEVSSRTFRLRRWRRVSLECEPVGRRESALKSREALQAKVSSRTCGQEGVSPEVQGSSPGRGLNADLAGWPREHAGRESDPAL